MNAKTETAPYREAFERRLDAGALPALAGARAAAFARFETLGFPTRRDEAWRFTDLRPLRAKAYLSASPGAGQERTEIHPDLAAHTLMGSMHRIVLVNGRVAPDLSAIGSLPNGVTLISSAQIVAEQPTLAQALLDATDTEGGQAFASLNAALFDDGFVLTLADGAVLDPPIEIIHWHEREGGATHSRSLIRLGAKARATVVESFTGRGDYWTNAVTRVELGAGAALTHVKIQAEDRAAIHFGEARAALEAGARYRSFVLTLGARLSRHESILRYDGEGAEAHLDGAYLLRGEQDATNSTFVDHAVPQCTTGEVFKGVLEGRAHGAFLGKIAVRPDAQKTDAHQLNKNLLLSPRAAVDTKPELEILADDVKCSHGATVGDLDEAALFYLAARGIPTDDARRMLVEAFAADAIDRVEDQALRAHLMTQVQRWLGEEKR